MYLGTGNACAAQHPHHALYRYSPGVRYGLVCREDCSVLACDLHDAEAVAVGIFQHDEIFIRTVAARIAGRPDIYQPLHFALLVFGVEIQVHSARFSERLEWFRNLLQ
jgi:hypothetical protein